MSSVSALIEVFRMTELSSETRASIIIKLGGIINYEYATNLTEPIVYELVKALVPTHEILSDEHYTEHLKQQEPRHAN